MATQRDFYAHFMRILSIIVILSVALVTYSSKVQGQQISRGPLPNHVMTLGDSLTGGLHASSEATTYRNRLFGILSATYPSSARMNSWARFCNIKIVEQYWD